LNRVLFLGINPSSAERVRKRSAIHRLRVWVEVLGLGTAYDFMNCIPVKGVYTIKDVDTERVAAVAHKYDRVVALGNFPSTVLKRAGITHYKMPHPSPRNRLLNDPTYEAEQLAMCREYLK
jgi:hypothetical protein